MPSNKLEVEFKNLFAKQLVTHESLVSEAIKKILKTPIPEEVKILVFETQSDWSIIPIIAFAMDDASPDETYFEEPFSGFLVDGGGPELVSDEAIDQDKYEDEGLDTYDIAHEVVADWFASIWAKCGGRSFGVPAYVGTHDRDLFVDLRSGAKCRGADIWPEE